MLPKSETTVIVLLYLYIFLRIRPTIGQESRRSCNTDLECNTPYNFIKCAYCNKGTCDIINKDVFSPSLPCAYSKHCYEGYCKNMVNVWQFEGYGQCLCACSYLIFKVHGDRCLYTIPPEQDSDYFRFPNAIQLLTPVHVEFNRMARMIVVVGDGHPPPILMVQDPQGSFLARIETPLIDGSGWYLDACNRFVEADRYLDKDVCNVFRYSYRRTVFVIEFVIPFDQMTEPGEKVTSFTKQMQMDTYHREYPEIKLTSLSRRYHLNYPEGDKFSITPIVRFTNCGKNLASVELYEYKDTIHLSGGVFYFSRNADILMFRPDVRRYQELQGKWKVYRVEGDTSVFHETYMVFFNIPEYQLQWDIQPFRMSPGLYVVNLTVAGVYQYWSTYRNREDLNFNVCFIKVVFSPLEAKIVGGTSRFVYKQHGLILDLSKSRNPNSPDGKSDMSLMITCNWTSSLICKPFILQSPDEEYKMEPLVLQIHRTYNFTLKVTGTGQFERLEPAYASQVIVVGDADNDDNVIKSVRIDCNYNCGTKVNPRDIVGLQVGGPWTELDSIVFEWVQMDQVDESGVHKETPVDSIRQSGTPSFILIINEDALKENTTYEFKVKPKYSAQFAMYQITTSFSSSYTCRINPESGEAGLTNFKLSCLLPESSKTIEFYDKHEADEPDFSGRMIAVQETGNIENFILTRGKLEILSFDDYGMVTPITLNVKLSNNNGTTFEQILKNSIKVSPVQDVEETLKTASVVTDLLTSAKQNKETNGINILEILVRILSPLSIKKYRDAKLGVSTLHIVLLAARGTLSLDGAWHAARSIHTISQALAVGLKAGHLCTFRVLYQIFSRILDCLYIVLEVEEKYVGNGTLLLQYTNPVIYTKVKEISQYVLKSCFHLQSSLSHKHLPAQKQKLIESSLGNLSIWIKIDTPTALSKYTKDEHRMKMFPAIVPDNLADDVKKKGFYLALQFVSFRRDPTRSGRTNTGDTFDVSVCFKRNDDQTCHYPKVLKNGIQVAFDISDLISQIRFTNLTLGRLDNHLEPDRLDIELPVYKIDPLPLADVEAQFRFYANNTELLVLVEKDMRPTYELLMKVIPKVTSARPVFPVVTNPSIQQHLYYLAIQPGTQEQLNETVSFDIKIYSKMCYTWHNHWETKGCEPKTDPGTGALICECTRLSLIGGLVDEVVFPLEVVAEFPLSLTLSGANPAIFLLLLLLTFLLLALICRRADIYDRTKRFVSILPDNFPAEKVGYLVRVVTGVRVGAGTDASVGVKIYGSINDGRAHILSSETYDVMERMGEDWFLIFEAQPLGKISCLDLWHDNAGAKPNWFCDSITIYDLHNRDCYFFVVNEWIALNLKGFPQTCLVPTPLSEIINPSRVFLDYFTLGFHLSHVWLNIIVRHPRDPVSRTDRLAITLCFILVSTAVSVMLISVSDSYMEVDDFSYSVTWLMVEMSIYTCIPAAVVACLLMHMFRRIYKIIFYIEKEEEKITHERKVTRVSVHEDYLSSPSTTSLKVDKNHVHYGRRHRHTQDEIHKRTFAQTVNLFLMPKPLVPVQIKGDAPNVIIKKSWLLITWITVFAVVIICSTLSMILAQNQAPIKTAKWLTIVGLSVCIHAIILLPLKIIFVSALLAVAFKRIIYKDIYTFDPQDGRQIFQFGMVKYLANLVHLRSKPMYQPLSEVFREKHRHKMMRGRQWQMLYELVVQIMFLVVLGTLLRAQISTKYQTNAHMRTLMTDFDNVYNTSDLEYFQKFCDPYLFKYIWYNWEILSHGPEQSFFRKDWIYDGVNRMVGKVRLRQFRVKPGYCEPSVNLSIDCAAPFSGEAEDSRDYIPYWIKQNDSNDKDDLDGITFLSKWSYKWPSDDSNFYYDGKTGQTYPSGGYTWDLGASSEEMDAALGRLWEEGWIGHYTRAVLTQVKVYNVNTRLFSEIALVAEQTIAGQILPSTVVNSVDINIELDWWLTIFIFFAFMLCVRVFLLANFVGVMGLFKGWRSPYEILMTVNALAISLYFLLHLLIVPQYVTEYQQHTEELRLFDIYKIAHYSFTSRALLCALYILNLIRFYSLWRFGKTVYRFFLTIVFSIKYIIWLAVIFVSFQLLIFRFVGYLLHMFIDVRFNPNMFYRSNDSYFSVSNEMIGFNILCFMMSFSSVIIMMMFVCVFTHHYRTTKNELVRLWTTHNYFTFVLDEIKLLLNKPIVRRTTLLLAGTMVARHEAKKNMLRMQSRTVVK